MRTSAFVFCLAACVLLGACASDPPPEPSPQSAESAPAESKRADAPPAPQPASTGMRINVDVEGVDLRDVIEQIGQQVGRNLLVDPDVQETVTVNLKDIEWREAVEVLARMTRCQVETLEGDVILLSQPARLTISDTAGAPLRTVVGLLAAHLDKEARFHPDTRGRLPSDFVVEDMLVEDLLRALERAAGCTLAQTETHLVCGPAKWVAENRGK